jgi:hypothetical protein
LEAVATQLTEHPNRIHSISMLRELTSSKRKKTANRRSFLYLGKDSGYPEDSTPESSPAPKPKEKSIKKRAGQSNLQSCIKV